MSSASLPLDKVNCVVMPEIVRAPTFTRREEDGVTYLIGRDYEMAYQTVLRFANGDELPITAKLFGDLNQQVVVRDAQGKPARVSGFVQGRSQISDAQGNVIFEGSYYDSRVTQALAGDDALTPIGIRTVDHWETGQID